LYLALAVREDAAPEADRLAGGVEDGEEDAAAKGVVQAAALLMSASPWP